MAKTKRSLLKEIKNIDPSTINRNGKKSWWASFREEDSEAAEAVEEAVDNWIEGGAMKSLLPSCRQLRLYLRGEHPAVPCDPPVLPDIKQTGFANYISHRTEALRGKEK